MRLNNPISRRPAYALALVLILALAGCGSSKPSASSASAGSGSSSSTSSGASAPAGAVTVAIRSYAFSPGALNAAVGTRVTFTNHDATAHTATSSSPGFDTGTVKPGASATVTLKSPGTYSYICQFHPFMHGTITVK